MLHFCRLSCLVLLLVLATGCGEELAANSIAGGGNTGFSTETFAQQIAVSADPGGALRWERAVYEAKAGAVTFVVTNRSPIAHNFVVEGNGLHATSKNFRTQTPQMLSLANLPAGEYLIVCTVPGHRESGMVARLVVT